MYTPSHFHTDDVTAMHAAMKRHPFALLVTPHAGELHMTHLPFHLDTCRGPRCTLQAHLAHANPHCAALKAGAPSVVVFQGPNAYVSPRWYTDPAKNVPTWNYVAIHAHGRPVATEDPQTLMGYISALTDEHEAYIERPWSIEEAEAHAAHLVGHIVGFELAIERLEGKFKLSQNRPQADRALVMREFGKSGDTVVAEMLELMQSLYAEDGALR